LLEKEENLAFANYQYVHKSNQSLERLISDMEKTYESITKGLKQSGMKIK
jgi:hypothetical protein